MTDPNRVRHNGPTPLAVVTGGNQSERRRVNIRLMIAALPLVLLTVAACAGVGGGCGRIGNPQGWAGGALGGDTLYIGTQEGSLLALDRNTGEPLAAEFVLEGEERFRAIYGTPAVVGDTVYVGGYNGILYALSLEGGELRRKARTQVGGPIVGSPVIVDGLALVGSSDGNLYAFDILVDDGELTFDDKWTFPTGNKIWSTPVVVDGVVYFGSLDHNVYAVSLEEGEKLWQFETGGAVVSTPVVTGGKVFVGSFDSVFYAIDAETAEEVWRFEGATKWFWAAAAAAKDTIYVPSLDGNLYALDMRTGGLLWTVETDAPIIGSPVIVFDMIAVPSADGKIWLANLKDESLESRCNIEEEIRTPLVEYEGSIYFGARDGSIRAMEIRRTGSIEEMWALFTDTGQVQSRWICTL